MNPSTRLNLTFIAGFCDTATFIHMDGVFSAHVTGNFVLFAAALAQGVESSDWLKILTFPVFLVGIIMATVIYVKVADTDKGCRRILQLITFIFFSCAAITIGFAVIDEGIKLGYIDVAVTLMMVLAMAMQNTLHHFIPGPMTTVMTGTVMNTTASLTKQYLLKCETPQPGKAKGKVNPLLAICFFALGCLISGFLSVHIGLSCLFVACLCMLAILISESMSTPVATTDNVA